MESGKISDVLGQTTDNSGQTTNITNDNTITDDSAPFFPKYFWAACILAFLYTIVNNLNGDIIIFNIDLRLYPVSSSLGQALLYSIICYFALWRKKHYKFIKSCTLFIVLYFISFSAFFAGQEVVKQMNVGNAFFTEQEAIGQLNPDQEKKLEEIFLNYATEFNKITKPYQDTLDNVGWENFLDLNRISKDKDLSQTKKMVTQVQEAHYMHESAYWIIFNNLWEQLENFAKENEVIPLEKVETVWASANSTVEKYFLQKEECFALCYDLYKFIAQTQGAWKISDNQILFEKDEDTKKFDLFLDALLNKAEEIEEYEQELKNAPHLASQLLN